MADELTKTEILEKINTSDTGLTNQFITEITKTNAPIFAELIDILMILSPSLLLICFAIRISVDLKNNEPPYKAFFELGTAIVGIVFYVLLINTIFKFFGAVDEFTGHQTTGGLADSLEIAMADFTDEMERKYDENYDKKSLLGKVLNTGGQVISRSGGTLIRGFTWVIDLLLFTVSLLMFLGQHLAITLAIGWGMIALPTRILPKGGFVAGFYKIFQIILAYKFVLFLFSLVIVDFFTAGFAAISDYGAHPYSFSMQFLIMLVKLVVLALTIVAPFIAIGLISNTGGLAPIMGGMAAAGLMSTKFAMKASLKATKAGADKSGLMGKIGQGIQGLKNVGRGMQKGFAGLQEGEQARQGGGNNRGLSPQPAPPSPAPPSSPSQGTGGGQQQDFDANSSGGEKKTKNPIKYGKMDEDLSDDNRGGSKDYQRQQSSDYKKN